VGVEKVLFNHKVHKVGSKYTKVMFYISVLCDLYVNPLCPLWLMVFDFSDNLLRKSYEEHTSNHYMTSIISYSKSN